MLTQILKNTEWREFGDFVSPALLKIMPASRAWQVARTLQRNRQDRPLRQAATEQRRRCLQAAQLEITLAPDDPRGSRVRGASPAASESQAQRVVELYFHQLFTGDVTWLDLRPRAFRQQEHTLIWHPAAWLWRWDARFLTSLRSIYRGFYANDDALFRRGLDELSLSAAEALFRKHFVGDQARVQFRTKDFVSTFHNIFLCCRSHGVTLAPCFLPLGLYLATLYEHLECVGVPVDVRAAFARVVPPRLPDPRWN